jgi:NAD-dependent deacetylase
MRAAEEAECLVAVGSTLQVYPIAAAVPAAKRAGARLVIVNAQPTQFDSIADVVLAGSISDLLPPLFEPLPPEA